MRNYENLTFGEAITQKKILKERIEISVQQAVNEYTEATGITISSVDIRFEEVTSFNSPQRAFIISEIVVRTAALSLI
jgi:hypothetical protein